MSGSVVTGRDDSIRRLASSQASLSLVVGDSGQGLPDAIRRRVLSLFHDGQMTAEHASCAIAGGTGGLGFAICARLAAEHGMRLRLLDSPVGTHIELSLPLAVRGQVELEPSELPRPRTSLELSGAR